MLLVYKKNFLIFNDHSYVLSNQKNVRAIHLVWMQELKYSMITIKIMTENWAYCSFQGWLQTEKMANYREQNTHISYITR